MSELIASTKSHIKRIVPNAKDILVKIERDRELYRSKIHVKIPGRVLHAEKKAPNVWEAVELSYQAIFKQIEKIKTKKDKRKQVKRIWKWQLPHMTNS